MAVVGAKEFLTSKQLHKELLPTDMSAHSNKKIRNDTLAPGPT
jgi:hypothetical protein